jgi:glycosyltransferase involved in cell wall biosynthesis
MTLAHIVPGLQPQIDGVGDYALNLAHHLRESHGIQSRFIVCDPQWDGPSRVDGFAVRRLRVRNEAGIWSLLASAKEQNATALLHFTGYGYQQLGVPFWLYRGTKSWLADNASDDKQLFTVFHELWSSTAAPWKGQIFLKVLQHWLVQALHRNSSLSVTGTRSMQAMLDRIQPNKTLCLPMPSNIPMFEAPKPGRRRNARLRVAIFGQKRSRAATIRGHANLLSSLQKKDLLASAMLIGKGLNPSEPPNEEVNLLQKSVARARIEVLGELSPEDVSRSLGNADLFLSHHPAEVACKSGAVMAALAAGCPAVLRDGRNSAPLNESEHFIASNDSQSDVERFEQLAAGGHLERIALAGRSWYERHADWKVVANEYHLALSHHASRPPGAGSLKQPVNSKGNAGAPAICPQVSAS